MWSWRLAALVSALAVNALCPASLAAPAAPPAAATETSALRRASAGGLASHLVAIRDTEGVHVMQWRADDGATVFLKTGDAVTDGWRIAGLGATIAILERDGEWTELRLVSEADLIASASGGQPKNLVVPREAQAVLDLPDQAVLDHMALPQKKLYADAAFPGLSADDVRRWLLYNERYQLMEVALRTAADANMTAVAASKIDGKRVAGRARPLDIQALLFPRYGEAVMRKRRADYELALAQYDAAKAAGIEAVRIPTMGGVTSLLPYMQAMKVAEVDLQGSVYLLVPPLPPVPPGLDPPLTETPVLTSAMAARIKRLDGQPIDAELQASILDANAKLRQTEVNANDQLNQGKSDLRWVGPFGIWYGQ